MTQEAATIVERYTTQPDVSAEKQCFFAKKFHIFLTSLLGNVNSFGFNVITSSQVDVPKQMQGMPNPAPVLNSLFIDLPVLIQQVFAKWQEMDDYEKWKDTEHPPNSGLRMDQQYLKGLCAKFGGDMPDENFHRTTQLWKHMSVVFNDMHTALDQVHKMLMNGGLSQEQSLLAQLMASPKEAKAIENLSHNEDAYKRSVHSYRMNSSFLTCSTKKYD